MTDDETIKEGQEVVVRTAKNNIVVLLDIEKIYAWNRTQFARKVLGMFVLRHPLVAEMSRRENIIWQIVCTFYTCRSVSIFKI